MGTIEPLAVPSGNGDPSAYGFEPCEGGVCAAAGIRAAGMHAGFRHDPAKGDLALVVAEEGSVCAATFTQNRFCAAPVQVSRRHAASSAARAIVLNSGIANAATGEPGLRCAEAECELVARAVGCSPQEVLVASTGVIGAELPLAPFERSVPKLAQRLRSSVQAAEDAARAVMTTDTHPKQVSLRGALPQEDGGSLTVHVGGFAKGSGMIQPNMATMLCVIATDAPLTREAAHAMLLDAVRQSFNKVTVDSDTSTNDSCFLLATGRAGGSAIGLDSPSYPAVAAAVLGACTNLARQIAADGEGATKLVTVNVLGAATERQADAVARAIANSPLVKTAIYGHDANWGRVAAAAGKCGVDFRQEDVDIDLLGVPVLRAGLPVAVDEDDMLRRFESPNVDIAISLGMGREHARVWTCDLTREYVHINGDYRS